MNKKGIKNVNILVHKLELVLIRVINHKLEVVKEKEQKIEEIIKKWKTKVIAIKRQKVRKRISFSSEKEKNYESDIRDKTNPNQANDK